MSPGKNGKQTRAPPDVSSPSDGGIGGTSASNDQLESPVTAQGRSAANLGKACERHTH